MERSKAIFLIIIASVTAAIVFALLAGFIVSAQYRDRLYVDKNGYEQISQYYKQSELEEVIGANYFQQIAENSSAEGAMQGIVTNLGDGLSKYYNKDIFEYFDEKLMSNIGAGVCLSTDSHNNHIKIGRVFAGTYAEKVGLSRGDILDSVNGVGSHTLDIDLAAAMLRGKEGDKVVVEVSSLGETRMIEIVIKQETYPLVTSDMLGEKIGYINIVEFSGDVVSEFDRAISALKSEGAQSLVLDIRGAGGLISPAMDVADRFIKSGLMAYSERKGGDKTEWNARASTSWDRPVIVLTDAATSGAAEVFAGAMQESGRKIVGQKTAAQGVVYSLYNLPGGDGVKLVTALYYTASGLRILETGITPNIETEVQTGVLTYYTDAAILEAQAELK